MRIYEKENKLSKGVTKKTQVNMEKNKAVVYGVVGALGVVAAVFAFAAEGTKAEKGDMMITSYGCIAPPSPADALAFIAVVLLLIAQATVTALTRCGCCCNDKNSNTQSTVAIICFIVSWLASAIAMILLLNGAILTASQEQPRSDGQEFICWTVKPGIFTAGGGLGIVACALGLYAYCSLTKHTVQPAPGAAAYNQGEIAMGHPQFNNNNNAAYTKQQQYAV